LNIKVILQLIFPRHTPQKESYSGDHRSDSFGSVQIAAAKTAAPVYSHYSTENGKKRR